MRKLTRRQKLHQNKLSRLRKPRRRRARKSASHEERIHPLVEFCHRQFHREVQGLSVPSEHPGENWRLLMRLSDLEFVRVVDARLRRVLNRLRRRGFVMQSPAERDYWRRTAAGARHLGMAPAAI